MDSQTEPGKSYSDAELIDLATLFLSAMQSSIPPGTIDPRKWWDRAKSALTVAASDADSWPQMVSTCAKQLQLPSLSDRTSKAIYSIGADMDRRTWERFRYLCERDAIYITAIARIVRDEKKEEKARIEKATENIIRKSKKGVAI